jgi:DNA transformation protein and related proteins
MASRNEYLQYVLEQLAALPRVTSRHMFGGFGLYCDGLFFALIFSDTLYFKVGDANREEYESRGMNRFRPYEDRPELSMTYYEVPADVLEDVEAVVAWARRAVDAALASAKKSPVAKRKPAGKRKRLVKAKQPGGVAKSKQPGKLKRRRQA